ncbi:hypothetical protein E2C01_004722 [Portunus trituberculatus]|uniref:Uncharacterized protein n=1 Tax=Portunus trituberculatus TaxID=210409 RepID=A0A5B7CS46_PORTR|nr:hypothetical protein [Portunus trituberculatus]
MPRLLFLKHEATYTNTIHIHHDRRQDEGRGTAEDGPHFPASFPASPSRQPASLSCPPVSWPRSLTFQGADYDSRTFLEEPGMAKAGRRQPPTLHPGSAPRHDLGQPTLITIPGSHRSLIYPNTRHGPHVIIELSVIYHRERWRMKEDSRLPWRNGTPGVLRGGSGGTCTLQRHNHCPDHTALICTADYHAHFL